MKPNSAVKKAVTNIDYIKGFKLNKQQKYKRTKNNINKS